MGKCVYPTDIIEELKSKADTAVIDAGGEAERLGNTKVMNIILLGTIIRLMHLEHINWDKIVRDNVKPAFAELNLKALELGKGLV